MVAGMPQKSMFRQLEEMGLDYKVYFELVPAVMMLKDLRHRDARPRFHAMRQFYDDAAAGDLPEFTWLEPRYYNTPNFPADDQHPDHDVGDGEALVKRVYESLRASPLWSSTALVITYDEHGGFFDHVPPAPVVPSPDDIDFVDESTGEVLFDFTRLGVRIPTLVVSPLVPKGLVVHGRPEGDGQFEHSSVIATVVHKLFRPQVGRPKPDFLNKRDAWAATFESVFSLRTARTDCPATLPEPVMQRERSSGSGGVAAGPQLMAARDGSGVVNDLQLELLFVVAGVTRPIIQQLPGCTVVGTHCRNLRRRQTQCLFRAKDCGDLERMHCLNCGCLLATFLIIILATITTTTDHYYYSSC
jgi:phospholipase C